MTRPIHTVTIAKDEFTDYVQNTRDYAFTGTSTFEGWEIPEVPKDFSMGLILGPSGSGKTLLLNQFGKETTLEWNPNKAIVSHFATPKEAVERLNAVGLGSVPSWCQPFHTLSNGEQFRANLARKLENNVTIDEYTSVVDRNVAKAASVAVKRYVDTTGIKGLVFASCHYDILEWLRPDWYFDTADGTLHDGRGLQRPPIVLRIFDCKTEETWSTFAKHHYLSKSLNRSCHAYLVTARFGEQPEVLVGFVSALAQPMGGLNKKDIRKAYREHRTVVLPDFQGMGIGSRISDAVAQFYLDDGKRYFSRTAHNCFGGHRDKEGSGWVKTCKYRKIRLDIDEKNKRDERAEREGKTARWSDYKGDSKRKCFSHEYVGKGIA